MTKISVVICWVMTPCCALVDGYQYIGRTWCLRFGDGGSVFLWSIGTHLPDYQCHNSWPQCEHWYFCFDVLTGFLIVFIWVLVSLRRMGWLTYEHVTKSLSQVGYLQSRLVTSSKLQWIHSEPSAFRILYSCRLIVLNTKWSIVSVWSCCQYRLSY